MEPAVLPSDPAQKMAGQDATYADTQHTDPGPLSPVQNGYHELIASRGMTARHSLHCGADGGCVFQSEIRMDWKALRQTQKNMWWQRLPPGRA